MINNTQQRVDVADVLRGFSIVAIGLLHSIEHFNFYFRGKADALWLQFADSAVWDSLFFAFGGKAYAIFALLFGFSFFIQDRNALGRGDDFRGRFMWRLLLLFLIAQLNAALFTAEVLVLYAVMGFVLPLFARASNKTVFWVATLLMLQPMEWGRMIYAIMNPDFVAPPSLDSSLWGACYKAQASGSFWTIVKTNLYEGQIASLAWAFENARLFQTPALFLYGMLIGRLSLFTKSKENLRFWLKVLCISLIAFFILNGTAGMLKDYITNKAVLKPLALIFTSLAKFSFMNVLVSMVILIYYNFEKMAHALQHLIVMGRMSLSNYIIQSAIGAALFYNWGLGLKLGSLYSVMIGVVMLFVQYLISKWWMSRHKQGPFEWLWKKLTWMV